MPEKSPLLWRVHTANLIKEILCNPCTQILRIPLLTLRFLLIKIGERAIQLNDPELNKLMIRLSIYSFSDPLDPDFDPALIDKLLNK